MRIGLDFGTSTSLVSESRTGGPAVVPLGRATTWMPSVLGRDGDDWLVGNESERLVETQLIRSIKRAITNQVSTVSVSDGSRVIEVDADEAITRMLSAIAIASATAYLSLSDASIVRLGCPAMWDAERRERLLRLAERAGIGVGDSTLIDEPIAAGVAWVNECLRLGRPVEGTVLVIDMGGGTLDVAVLDVEAQLDSRKPPLISVLSADGINEAGDAVDMLIANELARSGEYGDFETERSWLLRAARELKADLSEGPGQEFATVAVTLSDGSRKAAQFSRDQLSEVFVDQAGRMMDLIWSCLRASEMTRVAKLSGPSIRPHQSRSMTAEKLAPSVDYVLIAGGMARSHLLPETLSRWFPESKLYFPQESEPDQLIALGLSDADAFERMNLHRPGFDFVLEWADGGDVARELIYRAYEPLYDRHKLVYLDSAKHTWQPHRQLPVRGEARLIARAVSGENIDFRFEGNLVDALRFEFGQRIPFLSIEPNGRIFYRDGTGMEREFRVDQWPVILGDRQQAVSISRGERESGLMHTLVWHQLPYD